MKKMARLTRTLLFGLTIIAIVPSLGICVPFEVTYNFSGGFHIYGQQPVPQTNGFDYYFTPVALNTSVLGNGVTISNISVSASGTSQGSVINYDWEVYLGSSRFGLPEGQFIATNIDPVSGYTKTAPTQLQFVIGTIFAQGNYTFSGNYNYATNNMSASPALGMLKNATTSDMNLNDGLYAQLFFWTADNRNCYISFQDVSLTVTGDIREPVSPVPEPSTMLLLGSGIVGLIGFRKRMRRS